jgi:thiol-disulfide isomerase/thioredoxin
MHLNALFNSLKPLACALALAAGIAFPSGPAGSVEIGEIPPDYLGKTNSGTEVRLSESVGKIRIVTFWATWCAPCLSELPVLNAVQQKGGADRIQVVAVNINDRKNDFRKALRVFEDYEIQFVFDWKKRVSKKYDVEGIPHMLIIDVDGQVAFQHVGYNEKAIPTIVEEINGLLVKNNLIGDR